MDIIGLIMINSLGLPKLQAWGRVTGGGKEEVKRLHWGAGSDSQKIHA